MDISKAMSNVYSKWENKSQPQIVASEGDKTVDVRSELRKVAPPNGHIQSRQWLNKGQQSMSDLKYDKSEDHNEPTALFKASPIIMPPNPIPRPFVGSCCPKCLPLSGVAYSNELARTLGIKDLLKFNSPNGNSGTLTRLMCFIAYITNRKRNYKYVDVSSTVLSDERIRHAIADTIKDQVQDAEEDIDKNDYKQMEAKEMKRAQMILLNMKSTISDVLLNLTKWILNKLFPKMLSGIYVHNGQLESIRKASQSNVPLIYVPLHRSHLDYMLVTWILHLHDLRAPLVAAGNNLMIPVFGNLLRGLGAFFIKRKLDKAGNKDHLYRAILHTYMTQFLNQGHHLEFFIEGGRSRTGKSCMPKGGLLSVIVDTIKEGHVEDVHIVPVAINYEKIVDGNFIAEQLGERKVTESFTSAVRSIWKMMHSQFGSIRIDFCQPFSLRELLESSQKFHLPQRMSSYPSSPRSPPNAIRSSESNVCLNEEDDLRKTVKDVSEHIVYDATHATSLMSTNLLAFLLITKHRKGVSLHQLAQSMTSLREDITNRKRDVGFTGESSDVITHASELLGKDLVSVEKLQMEWSHNDTENNNVKIVFLKPTIRLPHVFELQYYANPVVSVFLLESVVATSIYSMVNEKIEVWKNSSAGFVIDKDALVEQALRLCDILQYEFIFAPPCADLRLLVVEKVGEFISHGHLKEDESKSFGTRAWPNKVIHNMNWDNSDEEDYNPIFYSTYQLNLEEETLSELEFLRTILGTLIESYWLVACTLPLLLQEKEEKVFFKEIQSTAKERLHDGRLLFEESFGGDALKNAIKLFEHWKVIQSYTLDDSRNRILYLHESYDTPESLHDIVSRIEQFKM